MKDRTATGWLNLATILGLACLVAVVFFPIVGFEFVDLDVHRQIVENQYIRGLTAANVQHILTSPCVTSYYPVRTLTWALDYELWGLQPGGFELTNGLIHLANVALVFWMAIRLTRTVAADSLRSSLAAAFSAGVFAVHPVVVEPVAWLAGREELLLTLGALGAFHFHLSAGCLHDRGGSRGRAFLYSCGAALCCAGACLSNAVGAVIPVLITAGDVVVLSRRTLREILRGTTVMWAIAMATVVLKAATGAIHDYDHPGLLSTVRWLQVLNIYWLNLKTILWPADLAVIRPGVAPGSFLEPGVVLGGVAVALTLVALWVTRHQKRILFGLLWFCLALGPVSQIMPHHVQRADRFLYLPLAGLVMAAAAISEWLAERGGRGLRWVLVAGGALLLIGLAVASAAQVQTWRDAVAMWENCVRFDPQGTVANCALAENLDKRGDYARALEHYERALRSSPDTPRILGAVSRFLATCPQESLRDYDRAVELATRAFERNPKYVHVLAVTRTSRAQSLGKNGRFEQAIREYDDVLAVYPVYAPALVGLSGLLATCPAESLRAPGRAVQLAERACELVGPSNVEAKSALARAYAAAGRIDEAKQTMDQAIQLARAAKDEALTAELERQRAAWQTRDPSR